MQPPPNRMILLGLIFALPPLIVVATPSGRGEAAGASDGWHAAFPPLLATEAVLVLGLGFAQDQRRRFVEARGSRPGDFGSRPVGMAAPVPPRVRARLADFRPRLTALRPFHWLWGESGAVRPVRVR